MKKVFSIALVQKYLMGVTGLGLAVFVLFHMLGNLLIFAGAKTYNLYAHKLETPFLIVFETGLLVCFAGHIALALGLSLKNFWARGGRYGRGYALSAKGQKGTSFFQKSLLAQGAVILVFVILHLITFKFGAHYETVYDGKQVRDLFRLVVEVFQNPWMVVWYLLALLILSVHLCYGLTASFQSLGITRFEWGIKTLSRVYAGAVTVGYVSLPLYMFFWKGGVL